MAEQLDVIVLDDDPMICSLVTDILQEFYVWGEVRAFTDYKEALSYCRKAKLGVALFILDVYLGKETAFNFLDEISEKFAWAAEDCIIMTGNASDDVVNMCIAGNITYLIEKPIKLYSLKLAVRAIVGKYIRFAKRLLADAEFARHVAKI